MRGLLSGLPFVLLCAAVNLAHADLLLAQSGWSSPDAAGGGWGLGQGSAQPWNGTSASGPRPGWENPLPFGTSQAGPYGRGSSDQGGYPLPYDDGLLDGSPWGRAEYPMFRDELPAQAAPGWFEQFPTGTYRPEEPATRGHDHGYGGYRFRPELGEGDGVRVQSSRPSFDPYGHAEPPASAYPSYRFRGDPDASRGGWQATPRMDPAYQFRPLNQQELGRMERDGRWRPVEREQAAPPPPLPRGLSGPGDAFGFEPPPWRGP